MRNALGLLVVILASGCRKPPVVNGVVKDVFGEPLEGATVIMEGILEQRSTDAEGSFTFPRQKTVMKITAGKKGYIKETASATPPENEREDEPVVELALYPDPPEKGFYEVGRDKYTKLEPRQIYVVGTELRSVSGLRETSDETLAHNEGPTRFVFSSSLRPSEIAQLDLKMHHLDFVDTVEVAGVLGKEPVTANLWVANQPVQFDLEQLATQDDYLITTRAPLAGGAYAFHTGGVLTSRDVHALTTLPKELQFAYAFDMH
jgi:hypothetical protein